MTLLLPEVLVGPDLVGSSAFRAHVGAEVSLALEIHCRPRVHTSGDQHDVTARRSGAAESAGELVLTGVAVPFERNCQFGGWVLQLADVPVYVAEAAGTARPDLLADRGPDEPLSERGAWVQVQGMVNVADDYVAEEVEQALQRTVRRSWEVQRIVRLVPTGYGRGIRRTRPQQVEEVRHTGDASSYLLDLVRPPAGGC